MLPCTSGRFPSLTHAVPLAQRIKNAGCDSDELSRPDYIGSRFWNSIPIEPSSTSKTP